MKRKLLILTTGGTIASVKTPAGLIPALTSEELLSYLPELDKEFELETKALFNLDSTDVKPQHWIMMAKEIQQNYDDYDGFVIAHGTDTMAYTAAALSYLIQDSPKPIVITGAQKPIGFEITDAKANLRDSILYAADKDSCGVQIVFDSEVILGTRAKKTKSLSYSAFSSINYPVLASIRDGKIIRYLEQRKPENPIFFDKMDEKVFLWKLTPGVSPDLIPEMFKVYDCIIIESFGVGGIPESIESVLFAELRKYRPEEKILAMTTQVTYEGSHMETYEVGKKLKDEFSILEAKDMTLEALLTKLMWIKAQENKSWDDIVEKFYTPVAFDTLY